MTPATFFFYLLAGVVVVSAAGRGAGAEHPVLGLRALGTLAGVGGLYLYMGADFVGVAQLSSTSAASSS